MHAFARILVLIQFLFQLFSFITCDQDFLESNFDIVKSGSTKNVELDCDKTIEAFGNPIKITRVIILKYEANSRVSLVAEMNGNPLVVQQPKDQDITVKGDVVKDQVSLVVTWPVAKPTTAGSYRCQISYWDETEQKENLVKSSLMDIKEEGLNIHEVNKLIKELSDNFETRFKGLESELSVLKYSYETAKKEIEILKAQNLRMKQNYESTCATKQNLNETINVLKSDITDHMKIVEKRTESLQNKITECLSKTSCSPSPTITTQGNIDPKYTSASASFSAATSPKPVTTTGSNTPETWPSGSYAMVKPDSGCPFTPDSYSSLFRLHIQPVSSLEDGNKKAKSLFHEISISTGTRKTLKTSFCMRSESKDKNRQTSGEWPAGTYCIGKDKGQCPNGFTSWKNEYILRRNSDTSYEGLIKFSYCCRNDSASYKPMTLPISKSFYLYRYKGQCQEVKDMNYDIHAMHFKMPYGANLTFKVKDGGPGLGTDGNPIFLCSYYSIKP